MAVVYNMTTMIASMNSGQTVTATFPSATLSAGSYTTQAIAELPSDTVPANDMVSGTVNIINPLAGGTYTVGSGGNYPSLTNTGGIFEAINAAGLSGNITINITSDLTGELGTNALNAISGGFLVCPPDAVVTATAATAASVSPAAIPSLQREPLIPLLPSSMLRVTTVRMLARASPIMDSF